VKLDPPGIHCEAIMESRHPDVFEMDAASRTGIGDIREILDSVRYAPVMARTKVYIIDEIHMLSTQAFNGLLKTLEEPPPHVKFIFATTEIRKVPVTVLSRCQRFDLKRVDSARLVEHLAGICRKESVTVEPEGLALIARAAEGSVRDSLSLLDQAIVQKGGAALAVAAADIQEMLGLADRARVLDLFDAIVKGDAKTALLEVRSQYDSGADPALILRDLLEIGHDAARAQAMGGEARLVGGADWIARIRGLAGALTPAQLSRLWQMLLKALEETNRAPDPIASAEMAVVRLCAAASLPPPEEAARLLRDGGGTAGSRPAKESSPPRGATSEASAAGLDPRLAADRLDEAKIGQARSWEAAVRSAPKLESFEDVVALVGAMRNVDLEIALEKYVRLKRFAPGEIEFQPAANMPQDLPRRLARFLKEETGENWVIRADAENGVESLAERRAQEQAKALDELKRHPYVAEALKAFPGAEITSVRRAGEERTEAANVAPLRRSRKKDEA
jgi:DNA polymerase-3 subunit gamma/tau